MNQFMRLLFKALTIGLLVAIVALSVVPPEFRPETGAPHDVEHSAVFALFGFALVVGYRPPVLAWLTLGPLFAASVELAQIYVPGRHARLSDFLVDAASAAIGSLFAMLLLKIDSPRSV